MNWIKSLRRDEKVVYSIVALALLATIGYFTYAYIGDYARYRAIESYDQRLDEIADELRAEYGNDTVRREKYCYTDINKTSHNLRCETAIILDGISEVDFNLDMRKLDRSGGVVCLDGINDATLYCTAKMRAWRIYAYHEDLNDVYR